MNLNYWQIEGSYAICLAPRSAGYEVNLNANPGASWEEILADKRWATPQVIHELRVIQSRLIGSRYAA